MNQFRKPSKSILFVSTFGADDACEELWSRAAVELAIRGMRVSASVAGWQRDHWRVRMLESAGIRVQSRPSRYPLLRRVGHRLQSRKRPMIAVEIEKLVMSEKPDLVVLSEGYAYPPIDVLEFCCSRNLPFMTIANGNYEELWPPDAEAEKYRSALTRAVRCFFVSKATLRETERQIGCELPNAAIAWSQYNVSFNVTTAWPYPDEHGRLRLACVGRLHPPTKGQDILLQALSHASWQDRPWHLTFYGEGPQRETLMRLVNRLGLSDRVTFGGYAKVEKIWQSNEVLVMPSRHEGLPLVIIEAMLCGRPVLATDVGGHAEVILDSATGFLVEAPTVASIAGGLERLWVNRGDLESLGKAAATSIRKLVPPEPIRAFADEIGRLLESGAQSSVG